MPQTRLTDIEEQRDNSTSATRPLRAVYTNGRDTEVNDSPWAPDEAANGAVPASPNGTAARRLAPHPAELGAVIDEFMQAAEEGEVRDAYGDYYTPDGLRDLYSALSHVKSELGTMHVNEIRRWHVQGMLDELRGAGLAPGRLTAVVEALHSLYRYAIERGLVEDTPVIWLTFPQGERARAPRAQRPAPLPELEATPIPTPTPAPPPGATPTPSPTNAMLALGGRVLLWTMRATVTLFVLIVIVIIVEFA